MENTMIKSKNIFSEIIEIFKYLDEDILEKIPSKLIDEIDKNKNIEHKFIFDETKSIGQQDIAEETKDFLSALYLMYCCNDTTKNEIIEICKKNEEKYNAEQAEKYSYENLFKNRNREESAHKEEEIVDLVIYKKENIFTKIINKIKNLFAKKEK